MNSFTRLEKLATLQLAAALVLLVAAPAQAQAAACEQQVAEPRSDGTTVAPVLF